MGHFILWLLVLAGFTAVERPGSSMTDPIRYSLCPENILSVEVRARKGEQKSWGVAVQLTEDAGKGFKDLTAHNIGRWLEVWYGDQVLVRARIVGTVSSGTVTAYPFEREGQSQEARASIESLESSDCGVIEN